MSSEPIRRCDISDFDTIWTIINQASEAYRGQIPADCLHDPYMSREELQHEIMAGVDFWGYEADDALAAVMGIQKVHDVTLIRHAYVKPGRQKQGIGGQMLLHSLARTPDPVLIGTWADAVWAIRFYERHGFQVVTTAEKELLLKRYWDVPQRQIATSVVLADQCWLALHG